MQQRLRLGVLLAGIAFDLWTGYRMARIGSWGLVALAAFFSLLLIAILVWEMRRNRDGVRMTTSSLRQTP